MLKSECWKLQNWCYFCSSWWSTYTVHKHIESSRTIFSVIALKISNQNNERLFLYCKNWVIHQSPDLVWFSWNQSGIGSELVRILLFFLKFGWTHWSKPMSKKSLPWLREGLKKWKFPLRRWPPPPPPLMEKKNDIRATKQIVYEPFPYWKRTIFQPLRHHPPTILQEHIPQSTDDLAYFRGPLLSIITSYSGMMTNILKI